MRADYLIVRHGNTFPDGEPAVRIGARTDLPLTAAGEAQSLALGVHLAALGITFTRVLTGPLRRARRTAELILKAQADPPVPTMVPWLDEIDHGVDEGRTEAAVADRIGMAALTAWDERGVVPPGWRDNGAERRRAWQVLFTGPAAGATLLVTSNGAARFALLVMGGPRPPSLRLRTGAYGRVTRDEAGTLALAKWDVRP